MERGILNRYAQTEHDIWWGFDPISCDGVELLQMIVRHHGLEGLDDERTTNVFGS